MSKRKMPGQKIQGEIQEPTYYARVPKMATMSLNPYELALYCHYKQIAAEDGVCFKSNKHLAHDAQMSINKMKASRASLEKKGFILVERAEGDVHENQPVRVTIRDVWALNHQLYAAQKEFATDEPKPVKVTRIDQGGVSPHDRGVSQSDRGISRGDNKEELLNKNTDKKVSTVPALVEQKPTDLDADLDRIPDHLPPSVMRSLGFSSKLQSERSKQAQLKTLAALATHSIWQAFSRGWDGVQPTQYPTKAQVDLRACNILLARLERGEFTLDDVENCTREQLKKPRSGDFLIDYVVTDISNFMIRKRNASAKAAVIQDGAIPDEWGVDSFVRKPQQDGSAAA